ncbi:MAG TPA: hypothetical protein VHP35_05460, partial [Terriglobia bacterium]|nr:hypothetical protein [Terriglobia bacterium]
MSAFFIPGRFLAAACCWVRVIPKAARVAPALRKFRRANVEFIGFNSAAWVLLLNTPTGLDPELCLWRNPRYAAKAPISAKALTITPAKFATYSAHDLVD